VKTGVEATFASAKLELCLPSPDVPESAGGAPLGLRLVTLNLKLTSTFTNPTARGTYRWSAFFTPFFAGSARADLMATQESRTLVRLPTNLRLTVKRTGKRKVQVRGVLTTAGAPVAGARVRIYAGTSATRLHLVRTVRTGSKGGYRTTLRVKKRIPFLRAQTAVGARNAGATACAGPSLAPAGCGGATLAPFAVATGVLPPAAA
jgi:hypothetical protein